MRRVLMPLAGVFVSFATLSADEAKPIVGTKELRDQCHAYACYTAALAEEATAPRIKLLTKAIELDPSLARAYYNRGVLYTEEGDLTRAKADFLKAVALNENFIYAHYNLACVYSLESHSDEALASLESALAKGYRKFDKIPEDSDLKNIKDNPALAALVAKYRARAATVVLSALERIQTCEFQQRGEILLEAIRNPDKQSPALALWAMHEPTHELRFFSMELWRKLDLAESKANLVRGLYDVNGYVKKCAGNNLASYGNDVAPLMVWALDDKGTGVPFYAIQVLAIIKAPQAAEKIVPFLRDDDPHVRIAAADSLARLRAVSALPQLKAALDDLPQDEGLQDFYKTSLRIAIGRLTSAEEEAAK